MRLLAPVIILVAGIIAAFILSFLLGILFDFALLHWVIFAVFAILAAFLAEGVFHKDGQSNLFVWLLLAGVIALAFYFLAPKYMSGSAELSSYYKIYGVSVFIAALAAGFLMKNKDEQKEGA